MQVRRKQLAVALVLATGILAAGVAGASTVTMDFGQLNAAGQSVDAYYNGGCTGAMSTAAPACGGPVWGVTWSDAIVGTRAGKPAAGGMGVMAASLGAGGVQGYASSNRAVMDVAAGFSKSFSFFYSTSTSGSTVNVYSGIGGTGKLLASYDLGRSGMQCAGLFNCWRPIDLSFSGIARSVVFGDGSRTIGFDRVSFARDPVGVPEPATLGLFGLGALLVGLFAGLRRRFA